MSSTAEGMARNGFRPSSRRGVWRRDESAIAGDDSTPALPLQPGRWQKITSIAISRIGVGFGGLSGKKVRAIVEKVFADWAGSQYVYEEYAAEEGPPEERRGS